MECAGNPRRRSWDAPSTEFIPSEVEGLGFASLRSGWSVAAIDKPPDMTYSPAIMFRAPSFFPRARRCRQTSVWLVGLLG
jgi:hypothetical protein